MIISNIWNDCPVCGSRMIRPESQWADTGVHCTKLDYFVHVRGFDLEDLEVIGDCITSINYTIFRSKIGLETTIYSNNSNWRNPAAIIKGIYLSIEDCFNDDKLKTYILFS